MRSRTCFLLFFVVFLSARFSAVAQDDLPAVDGWRIHASFANNNDVCDAGELVYVASRNALFTLNKSNLEIQIVSRVNGLSDVTAVQIDYDPQSQTIIVAYDNTNIDLIRNGKVTNIPEILNQRIIGDKTIHNISIYDRKAYLSCSFGVAVIDLVRQKVIDSYTNLDSLGQNLPVYDMALYNNRIYLAAGDKGLYSASTLSGNLSDWNSWRREYPASSYSHILQTFNGKLYGVIDSAFRVFNGSSWDSIPGQPVISVYDVKTMNNKMVLTDRNHVTVFSGDPLQQTYLNFVAPQGAIVASDSLVYMPVPGMYLLRIDAPSNHIDFLSPAGPESSSAIKMTYYKKNLWVAGGGIAGYGTSSGWNAPLYSGNLFYRFKDNEWHGYRSVTSPVVQGAGDFIDVAVDPATEHAFIANFGSGLVEMSEEGVVNNYTDANSTLQKFNSGFPSYTPLLISGLAFDPTGNLWVSNYGALKPLSVKTSGGQWYSYNFPSGVDNRPIYLVCDDFGSKWMINTRSQGILVFNEGGTLANTNDDQYKVISDAKSSGFLPSNTVLCLAKDKNGAIWTGTLKGLCIFNNPENVFKANADFDAQQIVIKTGLIYSNFLGDVPVYCIAVDPGNRKWIGTAQGVWLVSPDGYTVLKNFTTANSPLLSNAVYCIGIDESTGEVFFGTEKGMCSYSGTSTEGRETQDTVSIYPNPVKPGFTGQIAIQGLLPNAYVKVTDINGNLIYETRANGGMATWNGTSFMGTRAPTGVYLVYSTNDKGEQTWVGKILLVN